MKDKKRQTKIDQIVRYSFQQVAQVYEAELRRGKKQNIYEVCKEPEFRTQFMLMIEGQLAVAGMGQYQAILGNNVSLEIKISRKSLLIYEIGGKHFQLILYELPYINLPANGLVSLNSIESSIKITKEVKVEIKVEDSYIAEESFELVTDLCRDAFLDTAKWYLAEVDSKVPNPYLKKLETILLSLMYKRGKLVEAKDFNWHIAMSEVHDTRESFMHEITTNHWTLVNAKSVIRRENGLKVNTKKQDEFRPLKFYSKMSANFQYQNRQKRIYVVIWNAKYEAVSSVQLLMQGGFGNLFDDWKSTICSLAGIGYILFAVMILLMMFGGQICERVNEDKRLRIEEDRARYDLEVLEGLRDNTGFVEK